MPYRPILFLSSLTLAIAAVDLRAQAPTPPNSTENCLPAAGPVCPTKTWCDSLKCSLADKCAATDKCATPAKCVTPKITVIVPPPQVVCRPAATPCASPPRSQKTPPASAPPGTPPAAPPAAQQTYLVPQMSYTMQPVVTMQAVPTVHYVAVNGPAQPAAAPQYAPPPAYSYPQPAAAPPSNCVCPPSTDLESLVKLLKLLKTVSNLGADAPAAAPPMTIPPAAAPVGVSTIKEIEDEIARLRSDIEKDIAHLNGENVKNIKDINALQKSVAEIIDALNSSRRFEDVRGKLPQPKK